MNTDLFIRFRVDFINLLGMIGFSKNYEKIMEGIFTSLVNEKF